MKQTIMLLIAFMMCVCSNAQQWLIEYPHYDNQDVAFVVGDMSGEYNYALGYRYDKSNDILHPHALCVDQEGNYISKEFDHISEEGAFNSVIGTRDENVFVVAYCTDNKDNDVYEKMWIAILNPELEVLHENYIQVQEPYVSFGYTAHIVVNDNNEFVVLLSVAKDVTNEIMQDCDFEFCRFDEQCNLLSRNILENISYNSDVSDFVYVPNLSGYAIFGRAMSITAVNSISYFDDDFNLISSMPIDKTDNYPYYIRPYFVSVGRLYDDNNMLLSMQTKNTMSESEYCPLVLKVDKEMNILDSVMFERYDITDYVSQYNSIAYVNPKIIYVSSFEVNDGFGSHANTASVYHIDEELNILGRHIFDLGYFMNILYIQSTMDSGCIIQSYYEKDFDKVAYLCKLNVEDFNKDIVVEECAEEFVIEHYPNPVSSILNVKVESFKGNEFIVNVFDISGRRCLEENVFIDDDKVISMDLSSLSKGMYYYSIIDDCNHVVTRTFVKE